MDEPLKPINWHFNVYRGHDDLGDATLGLETAHDMANMCERAIELRTQVFQILHSLDAIDVDRDGWAIYDLDTIIEPLFAEETINSKTEVLICSFHAEQFGEPILRVLANEGLRVGQGHQWVTYDITVDHLGRTSYMFDVADPDKKLDEQDTNAILFSVFNDSLIFHGRYNPVAPIKKFTITSQDTGGVPIAFAPFGGSDRSISDQLYGLVLAESLVSRVNTIEPREHARATT